MKRMTNFIAAALAAMVLLNGCGNAAAPASSSSASAAAESTTFDEGVDTKVAVSYNAYKGTNGKLFLSPGDKVAVITPSAIPSRQQVDITVAGLKKWGYVPVEGENICKEPRTLEDIRKDLEWALNDPETKGIFCVRGGYGASEVMDTVSKDLISKSNKIIIGYSDITVYHSAWTSAGLPSIHACMSGTFDGLDHASAEAEEKIIKGEIPSYSCENKFKGLDGKAEGILIGGNLSTYTSVLGTAYEASKTDKPYILFLEDIGEDMQHIHRYIAVLKHLGVLDKASGIIFGEWTEVPKDMDDYDGLNRGGQFSSVADMITREYLSDLKCPVAFGFPAGHGDANFPLLMGEKAILEVAGSTYKISWE